MAGAAVHALNGFFAQAGGYEYAVSSARPPPASRSRVPVASSLDHALGHAVNRN